MRKFLSNLFRYTPRRLMYLVFTLVFLLMAIFHDPKWILVMVFTAFMYKARKPRNEIFNRSIDDAMPISADKDPDYLLQQFHDDLKRAKNLGKDK